MAEVLKEFMTDCAEDGVVIAGDEPREAVAGMESSGVEGCDSNSTEGGFDVIITGCHDFQHATARDGIQSLDRPHSMSLGRSFEGKVLKTFSSAQSMHMFILTTEGLFSMGKNFSGQCGLGDLLNRTEPSPVSLPFDDVNDIVKIVTGKFHSLLLHRCGNLYATGQNACGQLGLGDKSMCRDFSTFTLVSSTAVVGQVVDVAAGELHSLCCTTDGTLYSWGHPDSGVLGNGTDGRFIEKAGKISFHYVVVPEPVRNFVTKDHKHRNIEEHKDIKVRSVSAGKTHSGCLERKEDGGRVFTWGCGGYGRLGHATSQDEFLPREIVPFTYDKDTEGENQCKTLVLGNTATIGINHEGVLFFWGMLPNSPRGEATMYPKYVPELIDLNFTEAVLGSSFVCVRAETGEYYIWGKPVKGKLGFANGGNTSSKPVVVDILTGYSHVGGVSAGYGHLCWTIRGSAENLESLPPLPVLPVEAAKPPHRPGKKKGDVKGAKGAKGTPAKASDRAGKMSATYSPSE